MNASSRLKIIVPLVSAIAVFAVSAHAEDRKPGDQPPPGTVQTPKGVTQTPRAMQGQGRPQGDARFARGAAPARNFGGHPYRGHLAWEGGRWHHEMHNGRNGWWWDVGGVWYYYPEPMEGAPTYISEDYVDDVPYAGPAPVAGYAPPPPGAYYAPPPPPPPDPAASAIGGAVVGGLLGGLLTGRAGGAAAGAIVGGTTGAIVGATAASQPGYYFAQGNCYYRYPSGQYVPADPRACY
jgi:hypothetical protein